MSERRRGESALRPAVTTILAFGALGVATGLLVVSSNNNSIDDCAKWIRDKGVGTTVTSLDQDCSRHMDAFSYTTSNRVEVDRSGAFVASDLATTYRLPRPETIQSFRQSTSGAIEVGGVAGLAMGVGFAVLWSTLGRMEVGF